MADDKHYVPGDFYRIDDRTGFKVRSYRTRKEWTGEIVKDTVWEPRHPQDFVRGVRDDQTVPDARPRQTDIDLYLQTTLAAAVSAGSVTLPLVSAARMSSGDEVWVVCDDGSLLRTTINGSPVNNTVTLSVGLPFAASAGNVVTDMSVVPTNTVASNYPKSG